MAWVKGKGIFRTNIVLTDFFTSSFTDDFSIAFMLQLHFKVWGPSNFSVSCSVSLAYFLIKNIKRPAHTLTYVTEISIKFSLNFTGTFTLF